MRLIDADAAIAAVEWGITRATLINIETGEKTHPFDAINEELQKAVERIKKLPTVEPKKRESRAKLPCPCGRRRLDIGYGFGGNYKVYITCTSCGREVSGNTEIAAIRAWNNMVRKEKENARVQV